MKGHVGIGIDGKGHGIVARDLPDIGLVDLRLDLHMIEVLGDGEQLRCLEARRHGLPDLDRPVDDDAVERGADIGALEIDAGAVQRRLVQRDIGLGVFELCLGAIDICVGA